MIPPQEQLDCTQLRERLGSGFLPSQRVAIPPGLASHATDSVRKTKTCDHDKEFYPEAMVDELLERGQDSRSKSNSCPAAAVIEDVDLRSCLESWPYDPASNVHIGCGADGRKIILVRQPMGLQQFEMDGRPDGSRVHGEETVLQFHHARLDVAQRTQPALPFELTAADCAELFCEASALNHRLVILFYVKDWTRVKRDAALILRLLELVGRHARCVEDRVLLEPWRSHISRIDLVANAMAQLDPADFRNARCITRDTVGFPAPTGEEVRDVQALARELMENVRGMISQPPVFHLHDDSVFLRQDDFWTIRYHGQSAFLKSNKGLKCLACLLRSPGREFHVSQLVACHLGKEPSSPRPSEIPGDWLHGDGVQRVTTNVHDGTPLLDSQARTECKRRLDDLRDQVKEGERFNDPDRAAKARAEINAIANYLATATGLGGRDRKTSSEAERARCAVTKRIKQAIQKIAAAIPSLGHHLSARVKTGYFCSYNPHPERPVAWKF